MSKTVRLFKAEFERIDLLFESQSVSLSWISKELRRFEEKIYCFLSVLSPDEELEILNFYLNLLFKLLGCCCYFGSGNEESVKYLNKAENN